MFTNRKNTVRGDRVRKKRYSTVAYSKVHARTEYLRSTVRVLACFLLFMGSLAFLASALPHYRQLQKLKKDLKEVKVLDEKAVEEVDYQERRLEAIENDPEYRGLIARDCLNYYKPGEHVFRIEKDE